MNSGATRLMSNDSTWTISVVPRLAPSITAKAGHQIDQPAGGEARRHQPGRGAALQDRGDAKPGEKGAEPVAEGAPQHAPQMGSEGALDAGLHHMHAPHQERDRAGQIDEGEGRVHRRSSLFAPRIFEPAAYRALAGDFNPNSCGRR